MTTGEFSVCQFFEDGSYPHELADRFWNFVPDQPGVDCWEWHGGKMPSGYGTISVRNAGERRTVSAHRLLFFLCRGRIPNDLWVLHACDNPSCVNPSHLFLGTRTDNMRDASSKGRLRTQKAARKTHCPHGHIYTESSSGRLRCRTCDNVRSSEWKRRHRVHQ